MNIKMESIIFNVETISAMTITQLRSPLVGF